VHRASVIIILILFKSGSAFFLVTSLLPASLRVADSGDPVSKSYNYRFPFTGGIEKVIYSVGNDSYADIENEFRVKMATQ
jgi:hypothetical protein